MQTMMATLIAQVSVMASNSDAGRSGMRAPSAALRAIPPAVAPAPRAIVPAVVAAPVPHPAPSHGAGGIPRPPTFDDRLAKGSGESMMAWCTNFLKYFEKTGLSIEEHASFYFGGDALVWVQSLIAATPNITPAEFAEQFQLRWTAQVRCESMLALSRLMRGEITQGSDPVARYAERFRMHQRLLPNESQTLLCQYYIAGLSPQLGPLCVLDKDNGNREWDNVTSLINFSFAASVGLERASQLSMFASRRPQGDFIAPKRQKTGYRSNDRQTRPASSGGDAAGPSNAAAAVERPASRPKGSNSRPKGSFSGDALSAEERASMTADWKAARAARSDLRPPGAYIPGWCSGGKLTDEFRSALDFNMICRYCRGAEDKGLHPTDACPRHKRSK
jgi:hypothetical protein